MSKTSVQLRDLFRGVTAQQLVEACRQAHAGGVGQIVLPLTPYPRTQADAKLAEAKELVRRNFDELEPRLASAPLIKAARLFGEYVRLRARPDWNLQVLASTEVMVGSHPGFDEFKRRLDLMRCQLYLASLREAGAANGGPTLGLQIGPR